MSVCLRIPFLNVVLFLGALSAALVFVAQAQAPTALPKDVYADSRFRLPLPRRDEMDDAGKKVYDRIADPGRNSLVGLQGPSGIRLASPRLANYMEDVNNYVRYQTGFGDRLTEIAIMTTAREMDHQFEWAAHEKAALKAGIEPALIDIIKYKKPLAGVVEKEAVTIQFGRELFGKRKVSSETFAHALQLYGKKGLVDLVSLMSQYTATGALLTAFDMQLPEGQKPLLPVN
jgi:4-carboxymuconolactone decarboxylase